jgi:hypothetical protein
MIRKMFSFIGLVYCFFSTIYFVALFKLKTVHSLLSLGCRIAVKCKGVGDYILLYVFVKYSQNNTVAKKMNVYYCKQGFRPLQFMGT